jgi:hypothetical protein
MLGRLARTGLGLVLGGIALAAGAGEAQPVLPAVELRVGSAGLSAEVARRPEEIRRGLMFRERLAEGEGMLFVFARPQQAGFWMKDTTLPLSVAYLDSEGVVLEIHDLRPHDLNAIWSVGDQVRFALEVPQGWFGRHGVRPGDVARGVDGTLARTVAPP